MSEALPLRVTVAVPHALDTAPSQRFRWEQWAPLLGPHGIDVRFVPFCTPAIEELRKAGATASAAQHVARRIPGWSRELISGALRSDLLVVQRNAALAGPPLVEVLLARMGMPLIYDFDDAIHLEEEGHRKPLFRRALRSTGRVASLARNSALVMAGNETLAEYAGSFCPNVEVWPTTVSVDAYKVRPPRQAERVPVIGWSGSGSTAKYIEELLPLLKVLAEEVQFRVLIVGAEVDLQGLPGECRPWTAETELANLHEMDIGLMPLPDNKWTRGKCALKAIQYLGVGIPAVVSDVGINAKAVPDGECGYVVRDDQGWRSRLAKLVRDPTLRENMGMCGRKHVEEHYSGESIAPRLASRLRRLAPLSRPR